MLSSLVSFSQVNNENMLTDFSDVCLCFVYIVVSSSKNMPTEFFFSTSYGTEDYRVPQFSRQKC